MRHVIGFDEQILASLHSKHSDLHAEAVEAAGTWAIDAAWPHVLGLITTVGTDRRLLLAAISAVGGIRPQQAAEVLDHLADSEDPEIAEAVVEASSLTDCEWDEEDEDLDEDEEPGPLH
jgi:hypothetical protein